MRTHHPPPPPLPPHHHHSPTIITVLFKQERGGEFGAGGKGVGNLCDHCFGAKHPSLRAKDPRKTMLRRLRDAEKHLRFHKEVRASEPIANLTGTTKRNAPGGSL